MEIVWSYPCEPWTRKLPGMFGASADDIARWTKSDAVEEELEEDPLLDDERLLAEDEDRLLDWLDEPRLD